MKIKYFILSLPLFWKCSSEQPKLNYLNVDSSTISTNIDLINQDSLTLSKIDTSDLKGRRNYLIEKFKLERLTSFAEKDTLLDLNYDRDLDYIVYYYGSTGTGIKHRIVVFLFSKSSNNYKEDSLLTNLANPTFYLSQKKITSFYIGAGGGGGSKLEWIKGKWIETKIFHVSSHDSVIKWEVFYPLKNKKKNIFQDFQMIPPKNILETEVID